MCMPKRNGNYTLGMEKGSNFHKEICWEYMFTSIYVRLKKKK